MIAWEPKDGENPGITAEKCQTTEDLQGRQKRKPGRKPRTTKGKQVSQELRQQSVSKRQQWSTKLDTKRQYAQNRGENFSFRELSLLKQKQGGAYRQGKQKGDGQRLLNGFFIPDPTLT